MRHGKQANAEEAMIDLQPRRGKLLAGNVGFLSRILVQN
jgi:hypothetical protein